MKHSERDLLLVEAALDAAEEQVTNCDSIEEFLERIRALDPTTIVNTVLGEPNDRDAEIAAQDGWEKFRQAEREYDQR